MPQLKPFDVAAVEAEIDQAIEKATSRLAELARKARDDVAELGRAAAAPSELGPLVERAERVWVKEFAIQRAAISDAYTAAALALPDGMSTRGHWIELEAFVERGVLLEPGCYRALVAILPLREDADRP